MSLLFPLGLCLLLAFVAFATYRTGQLLQNWQPSENLLLLPFENIARLVMIAVCVGLGFLSGRTPAELGWLPADPAGDIGLGAAAGLAIALALLPPTLWVRKYRPAWHADVVMRSVRPRSGREWPLVLLAFIPVAVVEELLFRSLLLGGFSPYVDILYFAIAAAIFFGLLHLPQGYWGVIGVTLVALALSALFVWRNSLLLVVVAHWVANTCQMLLAQGLDRPESPTS